MKWNAIVSIIKILVLIYGYFLLPNSLDAQNNCINDNIPPIVSCQSDLNFEVFDSTISNIILAKALNDGSLDNCTPSDELHFAFSENPNDTVYELPNISPRLDITRRRRFLNLFAFDKNGLFSSCRTSIILNYYYSCPLKSDTIAPTFPCDSLGVAFLASDTLKINASYFDGSTYNKCPANYKFSFLPNLDDTIKYITKADLPLLLPIYATDFAGNQSLCQAKIYQLYEYRIHLNYFQDKNFNCELDEGENFMPTSIIADSLKFSYYGQNIQPIPFPRYWIPSNPSFIDRHIEEEGFLDVSSFSNKQGFLDIYSYSDLTDTITNHNFTINFDPNGFQGTFLDFLDSILTNIDFQIKLKDSSIYPFSCDYTFNLSPEDFQKDSIFINFPVYLPQDSCPVMLVDIGTPFVRRCFDNTYTIQYCNYGLETAKNAYIDLSFDKNLELVSSEKDYELLDNQQIRIHLGDVPSAFCDRFQMTFNASCKTPLGATHCIEAKIFPDTLCTPPTADWSGAAIEVTGNCLGDSIQFQIKNVGDGDMLAPTKFIVIEDVILREEGEVQLLAQEAMQFSLPANGAYYRMQAEQVPNYPYPSVPIASIEGCGVDENGNQSFGVINQFPTDDLLLSVSMDCQENRGAYDPNDKQVIPAGTGEQHFTEKNIPLKYKIRFQNTGTDTAFTVIIRDTLSEHLNPTTLSMGSSSHPYDFLLLENKILVVRFQDILLPDSTINEAKSHGFIEFEINQAADLPDGTIIQNQAAIYFDFNEPIITNRVFNTVGIPFSRVIANIPTPEFSDYEVVVMPNPFHNRAIIELKGEAIEGTVSIFNTLGQQIQQLKLQDNRVEFIRNGGESGIYFYQISIAGKQLVASGAMLIQDN